MRTGRIQRIYAEAVALAAFEVFLIATGIIAEPEVYHHGLRRLLMSPGLLITDYVMVGGLGAALVNAGIVGLVGVGMTVAWGVRPAGSQVAGVLTMTGFAFFGKNVFNIMPILAGFYLNALVHRRPFSEFLTSAMFGTALAPVVSQAVYGLGWGWIPAALVGITVGFLLPVMAPVMYRGHNGLNLYNMGLTAGILGMVLFALKSGFAVQFSPVLLWSVHRSFWLGWMFFLLFGAMCAAAVIWSKGFPRQYLRILKSDGRLPTDFSAIAGWPATLFNMGLVGYIGWAYVLLSGGAFNGPSVGGLLTMVGFAAYGKQPRTIVPVMVGVLVASLATVWETSSPGLQLAALFGTALAPVAGVFGPIAGFFAGFIHAALVMNVAWLHGGMNLYNNGFSAGIVATLFCGAWPAVTALCARIDDFLGQQPPGIQNSQRVQPEAPFEVE
ncbi:MAG: DUF1576 domain-containing protein [Ignavibacteriales bacterium]